MYVYNVSCIINPMSYINIHQISYICISYLYIHKYIYDTYIEASSLIK